jgi:hypothetical protein
MAFWSVLLPCRTFYGRLVGFVDVLVCFSLFGMLCKEKSGNPAAQAEAKKRSS